VALNSLGLGFSFFADDKATPVLTAIHGKLKDVEQQAKQTQSALQMRVSGGGGGGAGGGGFGGGGRSAFGMLDGLGTGILKGIGGIGSLALGAGRFGAGMLATRVLQRQMVARVGAAQMGGAFMAMPNMAADFEAELANLAAIAGINRTSGAFKELQDAALKAGVETKFTAVESVQALRAIMQTGQTAKQAIDQLMPALDLAAASFGKMSPEKASATLGVVMNQFQVDAQTAADKIVKIAQISSFQVHELKNFMTNAGSVAKQFKVSLDDMLIFGAAGRAMGNIPSKAGTQVQQMLTRMFTGGKPTALLSQVLGANGQFDGKGQIQNAGDALIRLGLALDKMSDKKKLETLQKIFGQVGIRQAAAFFNAQRQVTQPDGSLKVVKTGEWLQFMRKQLEQSQGTAEKFREELRNTFKGWQEMIASSVESIKIIFGLEFTKALGRSFKVISDILDHVTQIFQKTPDASKKSLASIISMALGVMTFLFSVHQARLAIGLIIPLIFRMGTSFLMLVALSPILLGLAAAAWAVWEAVNGVAIGGGKAISEFFGRVGLFARGFFSLLNKGFIAGELKKIGGKDVFSGLLAEFHATPENRAVLEFLHGVWMAFTRVQQVVRGFVKGFWEELTLNPAVSESWNRLKNALYQLGIAIGIIKPGEFDKFLKTPSLDFFVMAMEFGAVAARKLVDAIDWLTTKVRWASTIDFSKTFSEIWETTKTAIVVIGGFIKAIFDVAKLLARIVIRLFGSDDGNAQATMMERIEKAATNFKILFGAILAMKFAGFVGQLVVMTAALQVLGVTAGVALLPFIKIAAVLAVVGGLGALLYQAFNSGPHDKLMAAAEKHSALIKAWEAMQAIKENNARIDAAAANAFNRAQGLGENESMITTTDTGNKVKISTGSIETFNPGAMQGQDAIDALLRAKNPAEAVPRGAQSDGFNEMMRGLNLEPVPITIQLDRDVIAQSVVEWMNQHDKESLNPGADQLDAGGHID
jgi:TP901 family phage tail tape measure protein